MNFKYNSVKDHVLKGTRGITFNQIIKAMANKKLLAIETSANKKYKNQKKLIVNINGYAYVVPCLIQNDEVFLKTIYPSRKYTKKYLTKE